MLEAFPSGTSIPLGFGDSDRMRKEEDQPGQEGHGQKDTPSSRSSATAAAIGRSAITCDPGAVDASVLLPRHHRASGRSPAWMMRHPDHPGDEERRQFTTVLAQCPELTALHRHVRTFAEILTTCSGQHLKDWVTATRAEDLPGLHTFATGLEKDWDAIVQGLTTCWNSGPAEGRVNHIRMIKRQMFGRAKLPLLRKRVLLTAAQGSHRHQA
ncbi:transposase [Streptomyces sp. NPDC088846]|uniref:transposase n=1 Tax=Streptomyces sp. NPDC088846 TaxID=3365908 RepID=UPI0038027014